LVEQGQCLTPRCLFVDVDLSVSLLPCVVLEALLDDEWWWCRCFFGAPSSTASGDGGATAGAAGGATGGAAAGRAATAGAGAGRRGEAPLRAISAIKRSSSTAVPPTAGKNQPR
jgi:hypothetical protein